MRAVWNVSSHGIWKKLAFMASGFFRKALVYLENQLNLNSSKLKAIISSMFPRQEAHRACLGTAGDDLRSLSLYEIQQSLHGLFATTLMLTKRYQNPVSRHHLAKKVKYRPLRTKIREKRARGHSRKPFVNGARSLLEPAQDIYWESSVEEKNGSLWALVIIRHLCWKFPKSWWKSYLCSAKETPMLTEGLGDRGHAVSASGWSCRLFLKFSVTYDELVGRIKSLVF